MYTGNILLLLHQGSTGKSTFLLIKPERNESQRDMALIIKNRLYNLMTVGAK